MAGYQLPEIKLIHKCSSLPNLTVTGWYFQGFRSGYLNMQLTPMLEPDTITTSIVLLVDGLAAVMHAIAGRGTMDNRGNVLRTKNLFVQEWNTCQVKEALAGAKYIGMNGYIQRIILNKIL